MLKKHVAACLVATAFAAAPALAQTTAPAPSAGTDRPVASGSGSTTSGSSAMQPGASSGSMGSAATTGGSAATTGGSATMPGSTPPQTAAAGSGGTQGQFMTQMQPNQMMASKLIGTTVVGANNESIGDINDVVVDRNGQAMAVVIGVGGFLGIGEKDVAVPFQQLDFASSQQNQQTSGASGGTSGSTTTAGSSGSNTVNTTGSTGAGSGASSGVPDRIVLRMTKADLQAAPTFSTSNRNQGGGTTAPKP